MSHFRLVRNSMFNANGIQNTMETVKVKRRKGRRKFTDKVQIKLRNLMGLTVEFTQRSARGITEYQSRLGTEKRRRSPHETHGGDRIHRLPYGAKWYQRGRYAR